MGEHTKEGPIIALKIDHPDGERLAQELAELPGEPLDHAILLALRQRLDRVRGRRVTRAELADLVAEVAAYPALDARTPEQIIGYDRTGLPW